jgi:hypothetical protein
MIIGKIVLRSMNLVQMLIVLLLIIVHGLGGRINLGNKYLETQSQTSPSLGKVLLSADTPIPRAPRSVQY